MSWDDESAIDHLLVRGFVCNKGFWSNPHNTLVTVEDEDAFGYLCDEWDYAGSLTK